LEDLETVKVIGKGSGGVVQLVRHKWVGKLFALKVILRLNVYILLTIYPDMQEAFVSLITFL